MTGANARLRWGIEQRLEFIEFRLFWEGGVNRADLIEQFGVSTPQASNDLSQYKEIAPQNIRYDASAKRYFATDDFAPKFLRPNADRYLVQLRAVADNVIDLGDTWITSPPIVDAMPIPVRRITPHVLRGMLAAIRDGQSINIQYHSMNAKRVEAAWRRITPHAFGFDGLRWHTRAFCHIDKRFKDFILSRCLDASDLGPGGKSRSEDRHWNTFFDVVLAPNPALHEAQRQTIAMDYDMNDSRINVRVRCALLYYFYKRLRLDVAQVADKPSETPIIIANREDFDRALKEAIA